ncbi:sporulation integral membrane protein YlbJ [Aneurinibacillus sp. Ricciae_BoGa-3]|uniref:nucleoside recognition domain-containing protein n=1 Tax=Aneurinibacillus sp. Ricciae_BoGa-3 TaxID=3022697 RepID=UPI0023409C5C|nr:nucleoside recognition domain-containing protein [Aneurinibacillus sp. Ricciae_BoGa-3]WCK53022.1 sporulation integral membrane protein YlbJ [Aneurinibacillus sp. Ricciae_BoGa-3]
MRLTRQHILSLLLAGGSFLIALSLLIYPDAAFKASLRGLAIWWDVVFPALLPFFIASEILLGLGLAHFMGVLLEPLMRPIFNLPGAGSFVLTMGFASGYPMSAKLTSRLREQNLISNEEGERLVSFTTTADPVFITGAVAVGFFQSVRIGLILMVVHYASALLVGIVMSRHKPHSPKTPSLNPSNQPVLQRAFSAMHRARLSDGRPLGKLMGDAVATSIQMQLMIGGFIMFFSVVLALLTQLHIMSSFNHALASFMTAAGLPEKSTGSISFGLFEVTLGAKEASEAMGTGSVAFIIALTAAVLGWGGISIHAQVASILAQTGIRYFPFFVARVCHACISFLLTLAVGPFIAKTVSTKALAAFSAMFTPPSIQEGTAFTFTRYSFLLCAAFVSLYILLLGVSKVYAKK